MSSSASVFGRGIVSLLYTRISMKMLGWFDKWVLYIPIRAACCFSTSMISVPIAADRAYTHINSSVFVFQ